MKITLLTIGKTERGYLQEGIGMYCGRIGHYVSFNMQEIPDIKGTSSLSRSQIKEKEGENILRYVRPSDEVVLLDERGRQYGSVEFSEELQGRFLHGTRDLVFVIGGPYGFSEKVYGRADGMLSLSKMTFSHQMVRLIFLEQLYRAFTIIKGEPYHHK